MSGLAGSVGTTHRRSSPQEEGADHMGKYEDYERAVNHWVDQLDATATLDGNKPCKEEKDVIY
jgi:hypothetical protein